MNQRRPSYLSAVQRRPRQITEMRPKRAGISAPKREPSGPKKSNESQSLRCSSASLASFILSIYFFLSYSIILYFNFFLIKHFLYYFFLFNLIVFHLILFYYFRLESIALTRRSWHWKLYEPRPARKDNPLSYNALRRRPSSSFSTIKEKRHPSHGRKFRQWPRITLSGCFTDHSCFYLDFCKNFFGFALLLQ